MRLPTRVLGALRGPALAAALVGCSTAEAASPLAAPGPVLPGVAEVAETPDAEERTATGLTARERGQARVESERLGRLERVLASAEVRQERRISDHRERRRQLRAQSTVNTTFGTLTAIGCGRG